MSQSEVLPRRPVRTARSRAPDGGGRTDTTQTDRDRPSAIDADESSAERGLTADLYLRAHSPTPDRDRSVVATLDALAAGGELADYAVHRIPPEVDLDGDTASETDGHVHSLVTVADRLSDRDEGHGYPFRRLSRRSAITGDASTVLLLPVRCLLLYEGSDLIDVAPHSGPDGPWTVEDTLATVAASARAAAESEAAMPPGWSASPLDLGSADGRDPLRRARDGGE